jgi:ABC-type transport system involved in cytochrome bd biosynthesis fused ATPase/permease subunit
MYAGSTLNESRIKVKRNLIAYTSQKPWIQNASIEKNILFQSPMDRDKYNRILHAAALASDLDNLPAGDQTEIG